MDRAKDALKIAEKIAAVRAELASLESDFYRLVGDAPKAPTVTHALPRMGSGHPGGTIAERIKAALLKEPTKSFRLADLQAALPDIDLKSIRGTAGRLARTAEGVRRVGRGRYKSHTPKGGGTKKDAVSAKEAAE